MKIWLASFLVLLGLLSLSLIPSNSYAQFDNLNLGEDLYYEDDFGYNSFGFYGGGVGSKIELIRGSGSANCTTSDTNNRCNSSRGRDIYGGIGINRSNSYIKIGLGYSKFDFNDNFGNNCVVDYLSNYRLFASYSPYYNPNNKVNFFPELGVSINKVGIDSNSFCEFNYNSQSKIKRGAFISLPYSINFGNGINFGFSIRYEFVDDFDFKTATKSFEVKKYQPHFLNLFFNYHF